MGDTKIVGILNVTPDSFSDGGAFVSPQAAVVAMERMVADGADVIDIGAESTRPGATALTADEEWARLEPVLVALPRFSAQFSVDTRHAATAIKALERGVHWINDVSGFGDPQMVEVVRRSECRVVVMHSLSVPADKNMVMPEEDVVAALLGWARERIETLEAAGIARGRVVFDPGIGFGKTARQSWEILRNAGRFAELGVPVMIGHSRKSFLGAGDRGDATLAVSGWLSGRVEYLRVHETARHRQLLVVLRELQA